MGQAEAAARVNVLRQEGPTLLEELQGGQRARAELLKGRLSKREKWAQDRVDLVRALAFSQLRWDLSQGLEQKDVIWVLSGPLWLLCAEYTE